MENFVRNRCEVFLWESPLLMKGPVLLRRGQLFDGRKQDFINASDKKEEFSDISLVQ